MNIAELVDKIIEIVDENKSYEDIDYDEVRKELTKLLKRIKSK